MSKHLFLKIAMCLLFFSVFFFSCRQSKSNADEKKTSDPSLGKLDKLTVHGVGVDDMDNWVVKVPYDKATVATGDVKASFTLDGYSATEPEVVGSPVALQEGIPTKVMLKIPAQAGKHSGWSKEIKVIQRTQDGIGILQLASCFVCNAEVKDLADLQNLAVTIPSYIERINTNHIKPMFKLEGKSVLPRWFVVESLPLQIAEEETKEISLKVDATGEYKAWTAKIKIKREKHDDSTDPELTLGSLVIAKQSVDLLGALENLSVMLPSNVAKVKTSDVKPVFLLNGVEKKVTFTIEPKMLELDYEEAKALTITVPAKKGEYRKWSYNVRVMRSAKPEDPTPQLVYIEICTVKAERTAENEYFAKVPHKYANITQGNLTVMCQLGSETKKMEVKSEGLPLNLEEGKSGEVTLRIDAVKGKYKQWGPCKLTIKRDIKNADPELELVKSSFSISAQRGTPTFINDESIEVLLENYKSELERRDIMASFRLAGRSIGVNLRVLEPLPIQLEPGKPQNLTLVVEAQPGKYREWKRILKVTRLKILPQLKLTSLQVYDSVGNGYQNDWEVLLLGSISRVEYRNVNYSFTLNNTPIQVQLEIKGLPLELDEGESRSLECFVAGKEDEYQAWHGTIKITRLQMPKAVGVKIVVSDTDEELGSFNGGESGSILETRFDTVNIDITSVYDPVIKRATIKVGTGDEEALTIQAAGKKVATHVVATEERKTITIKLEFEGYRSIVVSFMLQKIDTANTPVELKNINLYTAQAGMSNADWIEEVQDKNNSSGSSKWIFTVDSVPYSSVKLQMEFAKEIKSAKIKKCKDERSATYSTNPNENDLKGIFSGRIAKVDVGGQIIELTPIYDKIYTEYLIAGYGTVEYEIEFTFAGRPNATYTIVIENRSDTVYPAGGSLQGGMLSQGQIYELYENRFFWFAGYTQEPFCNSNYQPLHFEPEYMGNQVNITMMAVREGSKDMYCYYHVYDDRENEACHEFVRVHGAKYNEAMNVLELKFDPQEKYVDAFIGLESALPILLDPGYLQHKWKKVLKTGFSLTIRNKIIVDNDNFTPIGQKLQECLSLRTQTQIYKQNNANGHANPVPFKLGKRQSFKSIMLGEPQEFIPTSTYLSGTNVDETKDVFLLVPTSKGVLSKYIKSFTCSIKKGQDHKDQEWLDVEDEWKTTSHGVTSIGAIVIGGKDDCLDKQSGKLDKSKIFSFVDGEVYKVEVVVTLLDDTKEYFDYQFYYTDDAQDMPQL